MDYAAMKNHEATLNAGEGLLRYIVWKNEVQSGGYGMQPIV